MSTKKTRKTPKVPKQPKPEPTHLTVPVLINYQKRLYLIHDVISTVVAALNAENVEHEPDFANILRRHGMDDLFNIIEDLDQITHHYDIDRDDPP